MDKIQATATELAGKDDRYLMIVAVLMLVAGGALVIRYLVGHLDRQQTRQETQSDKLVEVVTTCRNSLDNNTRMLERIDKKMLPAFLAGIIILLSGCATYTAPDGTRLTLFMQKAAFEGLRVSPKTGLSVKTGETAGDAEFIRAAAEGAARGAAKGVTP